MEGMIVRDALLMLMTGPVFEKALRQDADEVFGESMLPGTGPEEAHWMPRLPGPLRSGSTGRPPRLHFPCLLRDEYEAFFLGIGAHQGHKFGMEGEDACPRAIDAITFLRASNLGDRRKPAGKAVVGGMYLGVSASRLTTQHIGQADRDECRPVRRADPTLGTPPSRH